MSYTYCGTTRKLYVLGFTFENVALFDIEQYIEEAVRKHENLKGYRR